MIKVFHLKKIMIFVLLICAIFAFWYYKKMLFGNNISKNRTEKKENQILSQFDTYTANIDVIVFSNKTQNEYKMYQEVKENYSRQEILEGEILEGVKIEISNNNLRILNNKLDLEKVYCEYEDLMNHAMFLNSFVKDYRETKGRSYEENGEIVLEVDLSENPNTYIRYKKLIVDSKTLLPKKMEVKDDAKEKTICILYTNIECK